MVKFRFWGRRTVVASDIGHEDVFRGSGAEKLRFAGFGRFGRFVIERREEDCCCCFCLFCPVTNEKILKNPVIRENSQTF